MKYFVEVNSLEQITDTSQFNDTVNVFSNLDSLLSNFDHYYTSIHSPFIISMDDDIALKKIVDNDVLISFIFHKDYFTIINRPLFKISKSFSAENLDCFWQILNCQGYNTIYLWIEDKIQIYPKNNSEDLWSMYYTFEIKNNFINALLPNSFIFAQNHKDLKIIKSSIEDFLAKNAEINKLITEFTCLNIKYQESQKKLEWFQNNLDNYKSYNKVLKSQLAEKRIINYGGSFANNIRRIGIVRKILRILQKK